MSTTKQKEAAKKNIAKAREVQSERAHGAKIPRQTRGLSTAEQDKLPANVFAFPKERKEPLTDARHVRNAIARFDQVEGMTDREKDAAWKRITKAADKYNVDIGESSWRELGPIGKSLSSKKTASASKPSAPKKTTASKSTASKSTAGKSTAGKSTAGKSSAAKKTISVQKPAAAKKTISVRKPAAAKKTISVRKPAAVKK